MKTEKTISLPIEASLYELLQRQAETMGESVNDLICQILQQSAEAWDDYCRAIENLSADNDKLVLVAK
ncbi:MAG: hypothetical protein MJ250_07640 [Alphaproteobacteria bacterium]|nr:hypothetical protein [Alphaproteobacteria bacterium]